MIIDAAAFHHRYISLHPLFERAFRYLADADLRSFAPGRHPVDGDQMYLSIDHVHGRGREAARLEAHRRYIDIQYTIEGDEEIGWMPLADAGAPSGPFDAAKDIGFFVGRPTTWLAVPEGTFAVFFPHDAHAPLAGRGAVKKAIMKVAVQAPQR
jgi:YhcH/YjgK/YiaL family protein